ncbi:hypothetical protein ACFSJU_09065 [Paradesertivirga mongoliensis]|uniref:GerMN domain-containing protein n=1 Tax=Paradesertivirga mongoliensis TaxID=2100740 RepID=A0ABW4ZKD2_9SPHI|nr:hypothetical protein [Pedobacter mongoliensis]
MRRIVYVLLAYVLVVSCSNESENKVTDQDVADTVVEDAPAPINAPPYAVEYDQETQDLNLVRSKENIGKADVDDMLRVINAKYEGIKLDLISSKTDTVNLRIADASKLTQEMGSAGAEAYLAEVTFSLTELPGIKAIKVEFEEGDHAMPGVYTREDFKNVKIKK